MRYNKILVLFSLLFLAFFLNLALASSNDRTARLRYSTGEVTLNPSDNQRGVEAVANSPVLDGDQIQTGNGRSEVSFRNGVVLRVGDYSSVRINSVYDPMSIELTDGTIFVDSGNVGSLRDELEVVSGDVQIYMISEGTLRIDHGSEGSIRVTSVAGEAEVRAAGRRVLLEAGERTYVDPGQSPEQPQMYSENYDDLDSWNESRSRLYARQDDNRYVDESVSYDSSDLYGYGDWRSYQDYGYVWVPRVSVGWRPYSDGYWNYYNDDWFWVSYEPWGWAPYHYGRWGWSISFGWYWIPGDVFGPSWVSWYNYGDYVGWCPLNYWNQPVYCNDYNCGGGSHYNLPPVQKQKTLDAGNAWTFVKKEQVGASNIRNISLGVSDVKKIQIDQKSFRSRPDGSLVDYVLPKARSTGDTPGNFRVGKGSGNSGVPDIKNQQNETVTRKNTGVGPREVDTVNRVPPELKQKQSHQSWEQDRTHNTTRETVDNAPPVKKQQQSWKDYSRDNQFDRGGKTPAPGGSNSGWTPLPRNSDKNQGTVVPKTQQWKDYNRDDQFNHYGGSPNSDQGGANWFRSQKDDTGRYGNYGGPKDITPRYTDDVKRMFDYFNWNNRDNNTGGDNSGNAYQKYRYSPPPPSGSNYDSGSKYRYSPPSSGGSNDSGGSKYHYTPPPSGGNHGGSGGSHGGGVQPKQHSGSHSQPPPKPKH